MTIDEQRYLLNQDCLLMKYQRGNAMNEPLQIFRGKWADGLERLHQIIDKEVDSLRFYYLGNNYKNKVEHIGVKPSFNVEEDVLFI